MPGELYEGGCLCGAIRYRVEGPARNLCWCHCRSCRLASGAPFVAWATFDRARFQLVRGELATHRSSEPVLRGHCRSCGTSISYEHRERPGELDLTLATLDDARGLKPECHIMVSHKLPWVALGDGLPQFREWRGASEREDR
jgi:hypothetical protein